MGVLDGLPSFPPAGVLPEGATSARLCSLGSLWQPPREPLTADVNALVDLVNRQEPIRHFNNSCLPDHRGDFYALLFTYPDGTSYSVWGSITNCDRLLRTDEVKGDGTGPVWRSGAVAVREAFLDSLAAQRQRARPSEEPPPAECPERLWSAPMGIMVPRTIPALHDVKICRYVWTEVGSSAWTYVLAAGKDLSPELTTQLNDQLPTATTARPPSDDGSELGQLQALVANTVWGDSVQFVLEGDQLVLVGAGTVVPPPQRLALTPSAELLSAMG